MNNPFNNLPKNWQSATFANIGSGSGGSGFATLQTPAATSRASSQVNAGFQLPGADSINLPDWLNPNSDSQIGELLSSYAGVQSAFDPTAQVQARNDAIGYNTAAGGQAANNAASEYANRAAQQGGSTLGAGVVKAQAMMPVLAQNAALKTNAADVAAKAHQDAASLASQIAGTIGNLRTSYLSSLTGFVQGQQGLALDAFKANQAAAGSAADRELQYARLREEQRQSGLSASATQSNAGLSAAKLLMDSRGPSGMYTTDRYGQVNSGQNVANSHNVWTNSRTNAMSYLNGLLR